jgi:hypothetical protein
MSDSWWISVNGPTLAQGDLLADCLLPIFARHKEGTVNEEEVKRARLIIVTQSCDLDNNKVTFVALCPANTLPEFEASNPDFSRKTGWELVRKGRVEALHLLDSAMTPGNNAAALVVDFGHIVSVPFDYLSDYAGSIGNRPRLASPFLEHFSQAFARFFMRVGLPSSIAPYKTR